MPPAAVRAGVPREPAAGFDIRRLSERDLDRVTDLYASVFSRTIVGFLARRGRPDFERVLGSPNVSVGAFRDGELIGYQLHNQVCELRFDESRFRDAATIVHAPRVLFGKGTVIAVEHQGSGVAAMISAMVADLSRSEGYRYRIGQVHVGNIHSLKYVLSTGRFLIGVSTDEFGLNFISCGFFGRSLVADPAGSCALGDVDTAAIMLERSHAIALEGEGRHARLVFAPVRHLEDALT